MILFKSWLVLVTLVGGVAVGTLLIVPRLLEHELATAHQGQGTTAQLEHAQEMASLLLQLNTRKWLDTTAELATDGVLVDALMHTADAPEPALVPKTVTARLRRFQEEMQLDLLLATDAAGHLVGSVEQSGDSSANPVELPKLVAEALRGRRGESYWQRDHKLYRIVAAPVYARIRDRNVGVLLVGQELGSSFVQSLSRALAAEVALVGHGELLGVSRSLPIFTRLPDWLAQGGRDDRLLVLGSDPVSYALALSSLEGGQATEPALLALAIPRPPPPSWSTLVEQLRASGPERLPWRVMLPVAGVVAAMLLWGLFLFRVDVERPLHRATRAAMAAPPAESDVASDEEHELRAIFSQFIASKERCGEPLDGVTFDQFAVKLRRSREALLRRYACKEIKFQVYIKEGKTTLKATPQGSYSEPA